MFQHHLSVHLYFDVVLEIFYYTLMNKLLFSLRLTGKYWLVLNVWNLPKVLLWRTVLINYPLQSSKLGYYRRLRGDLKKPYWFFWGTLFSPYNFQRMYHIFKELLVRGFVFSKFSRKIWKILQVILSMSSITLFFLEQNTDR